MKRKFVIPVFFLVMMLASSLVLAGDIVFNPIPEGMSIAEYRQSVADANRRGFFLSVVQQEWRACIRSCSEYRSEGDCNACLPGELESNTYWTDIYGESETTPDLWCAPYIVDEVYIKNSFCTTPTVECSGGGQEGDRKCEGSSVFECSEGGSWEFVDDCDFGCLSGKCQAEQCQPHDSKQCSGNSVYWFNSCGEREEQYMACSFSEVCNLGECEKRNPECTTNNDCNEDEECVVPITGDPSCIPLQCDEDQIIQDHECLDVKPPISSYLVPIIGVSAIVILVTGGLIFWKTSQKTGKKRRK